MTTPEEFPVTFKPRSVTDSIDGDNSQAGACSAISNLLFDPSTPGVLLCRPAVQQLNSFTGFSNPTIVSAGFQLNGIIYGLVATDRFPGKDEPFAFDISSGTFLSITGVTTDNCPNTLPSSGQWVPPDAEALGPRIVFTHPGFVFGAGNAFGYFDTSSFSTVLLGNTVNGGDTITGDMFIGGIGPGYTITGAGIPANTTVKNLSNVNLTAVGVTNSNTSITGVNPTTGIAAGQRVSGAGIPVGAVVTNITGSTVTISLAATASASGVQLFFTGTTITVSNPMTITANGVTLTVTGGTTTNPLWATGNITENPLVALPTTVSSFNNRFYFGVENALVWTDTLSLNATSSDQVLFIGDSTPITAMSPSQLSTTTQAMIQALIIFKSTYITQLTGDSATSNLALNAISETSVGTDSPRSVAITPEGILFRAVDGVRLIQLSGVLTDPDPDLAIPFIYALYPSRISAAFNNNTYRICLQNGSATAPGAPVQEYWKDIKRGGWTGPHTFPQNLAIAYGSTFILFSNVFSPSIWQSDVIVNNSDTFQEVGSQFFVAEDGVTPYVAEDGSTQFITEDTGTQINYVAEDGTTQYVTEDGLQNYIAEGIQGFPMEFLYQTVSMTDFNNVYANTCLNTTLDMAVPSNGVSYIFTAYNEIIATLATAIITAPPAQAIWGAFLWAYALWGSIAFGLQPQTIPWPIPLVFNRMALSVAGRSSSGLKLGSWHIVYKKLKYLLH